MRLRIPLIALIFSAAVTLTTGAQPNPDPIAENFYTLDMMRQVHEMIGITEDQKASVMAEAQQIQEAMSQTREMLAKESAALAELVKLDKVDEKAVLAQADKVMALEADAKRAQLRLLIKIKNALTPEQQAKLKELKGRYQGLQRKLGGLIELAKRWQAEGGDPSVLQPIHEEYQGLLQQGKFEEAEALIAKTKAMINEKLGKK